jgi:hypothetical protein
VKYKMKLLSILSLVAASALLLQLTVSAAGIDYTGTGYISILMSDPDTKEPVPGAIFELFYVGAINESSSELAFYPAGDFANSGVSFSDMTASKSAETAKTLELYALANKISGVSQTTGANGKAKFSSLQLGLYLVVPKNAFFDTPLENLIPFLVSVPIKNDNSWNYGVNVYPKARTASVEETTTAPAPLPQTGLLRWPIPVLSIAGLFLFSLGWAEIYIRRKNKQK